MKTDKNNNLNIPQKQDGPGFTISPDELAKLERAGTQPGVKKGCLKDPDSEKVQET